MSTQSPTRAEASPEVHTAPPTNGRPRPRSPEPSPSTECGKDRDSQRGEEVSRHDSKQLRPTTTSGLQERLKNQKDHLKKKSKPPGGFDPTPLPDAPQGYTVKFTFHRASNLPAGDLHLSSSDPFIHATLLADVPRRHKEDPLLTHRTRTVRRTTEPVWDEDWIVANVPSSGFMLKCRLYDEDWPDHDDRLGNVTIRVPRVDENWEGFGPDGRVFEVKKRSGSKRAYLARGLAVAFCGNSSATPRLHIGIKVLGKSDPPHAQMYTVGPTTWVKHYSPMIGRLAGVRVNKDEEEDAASTSRASDRQTKKYDFQANEIQLSGPVPPKLYHRYVEFRPMIGRMFLSRGIRGNILHKVLHKQHSRIYNYDSGTEYGSYAPRSEEASLQFLRMAHFDESGRIFTYVITLDGMMRFTETGKEFGIDLLSKHTMHSDVATYIACAGEFFIRRLAHPVDHNPNHDSQEEPSSPNHDSQEEPSSSNHDPQEGPSSPSSSSSPPSSNNQPSSSNSNSNNNNNNNNNNSNSHPDPNPENQPTHPPESPPGGPPSSSPPDKPNLYQLIIDNDSGTYRPDESVLPVLQSFLSANFPGLDVVAMHCGDDKLSEMKKEQAEAKKREGTGVRMVLNRSPSGSSFSSDDESRLGALDDAGQLRSRKERVFDAVWRGGVGGARDVLGGLGHLGGKGKGTGKGKGKGRS